MGKLNERIHEIRLSNNLTLLQVAEYLGVSEATVQRYESGEIKNIKYNVVTRLARLFQVSPSYLMGWQDNRTEACQPSLGAAELLHVAQETEQKKFPAQAALEMKNLFEYIISKMENGPADITDEIRYVNEYIRKKYGASEKTQT